MSISNVSSPSSIYSVQPVSVSVSSVTQTSDTAPASGVNVDISKPGQLMSQLSSLAQSDPAQFKTVTANIAQQLKDAASSQSGASADILNKLADKFGNASQSGNASDLAPAGGHHHHGGGGGHHRVHAAASDGSASAATGGSDPLGQLVQGIISSALDGAGDGATPSAGATST